MLIGVLYNSVAVWYNLDYTFQINTDKHCNFLSLCCTWDTYASRRMLWILFVETGFTPKFCIDAICSFMYIWRRRKYDALTPCVRTTEDRLPSIRLLRGTSSPSVVPMKCMLQNREQPARGEAGGIVTSRTSATKLKTTPSTIVCARNARSGVFRSFLVPPSGASRKIFAAPSCSRRPGRSSSVAS